MASVLGVLTEGMGAVLLRAFLCGFVVWIVVRSVDHAPPTTTAAIISLPMGIAAGFAAVATHSSTEFLMEAIRRGLQMFVGIIVFIAVAGRYFDRLKTGPLLCAACLAWFISVLPALIMPEPLPIPASLVLACAGMALSHLAFPFDCRFPVPSQITAKRRPAWPVAVQAIVLVLVLSLFANILGPGPSAALASVPAVLIFITIAMKKHHSRSAALTFQSARLGAPCLYAYLVSIAVFVPYFGNLPAVGLAFVPALMLSGLIVIGRVQLGTGQKMS